MRNKKITVEQLDALKNPALEDIMALVNGGKYEKFFRDRPYEFSDGSKEYLTRKGATTYRRLTSILCACARLVNDGKTTDSLGGLIEELDDITREVS